MRKLLLLIVALLAGVSGAWATVSFDGDTPYVIKHKSSSLYVNVETAGTNAKLSATKSVMYLTASGDGYTISNLTNKLYATGWNANANASNSTVWKIEAVEGEENTYTLNQQSASNTGYLGSDATEEGSPLYCNKPATKFVIEVAPGIEYSPSIPKGKYVSIAEKANTFTVASSAADNDHWYLITNSRIKNASVTDDASYNTPIHFEGMGQTVKRAARYTNPAALDNNLTTAVATYLVRFVSAGDGVYNIQFANGAFINSSLKSTPFKSEACSFSFYNTTEGGSGFGWNDPNKASDNIVDNNGEGGTLAFWGTGTVTATSGNNVWSIYPVTFTDAIVYPFTTDNGAFFQSLTTNKTDNSDCNLWLSKNASDRPQLKLVTNDASTSGGNNMRKTDGLFTKAGSEQYNISVSEGKIKSYTIVGTAVGALSITPADGSAEEFAASASVSKKVTLASPAKQTSFTLSGSSQWLNVEKILIEWESDATIVSSLGGISNDGIYMLEPYNAERGVMYAGTDYLDACGGHANSNYPANSAIAIDATVTNQQFVLYTYNGNTYLYNIGRAKFVGIAPDLYYQLTSTPTNKWTVSNGAYSNYFHITSQADNKMATINAWNSATATMKGQNISGGKDYGVTGTTSNEEANNFLLTRVGTLTSSEQEAIESIIADYEALMTNLDKLDAYTVGTGVGEYHNNDIEDEATKDGYISGIRSAVAGYSASYLSSTKDAVATAITGMTLNSVPTNAFYRFKANKTGKYIGCADSGKQPLVDSGDAGIYFYTGDKYILSYKYGRYFKGAVGNALQTIGGGGESFTFYPSGYSTPTLGTYRIRETDNTNGSIIAWTDGYLNGWGDGNHELCEWIVEAVESLPITFKGEYASFYSPVDLEIPDNADLKVYTGTLNGEWLTLNEVTGTLPANTGVILHLDNWSSETTVDFPILSTVTPESSDLTGKVAAQTAVTGGVLVLGKSNDVWGIYNYEGTLGGFKAYMDKPAGVKGFAFNFGDADAIANVLNGEENTNEVYDLSGRKVSKPTRGLYIVNGKKVVVK